MKLFYSLILLVITLISNSNSQTWEQLSKSALTGNIQSFVSMGDTLFAGDYGNGVYYSIDDAQTWSNDNIGLKDKLVTSLIVNGSRLFAGTRFEGIFYSDDYGKSWTQANNNLLDKDVLSMILVDSYIFAGTKTGMYISVDNGNSWTKYNFSKLSYEPTITCFANKGNLVFANNTESHATNALVKSTDFGASWTAVDFFDRVRDICFDNDNVIVSGFSFKSGIGVYISSDKGNTWVLKRNNLAFAYGSQTGGPIISNNNILITAPPQGYTACIFVSSDHGEDWHNTYCMNNPYCYSNKMVIHKNKIIMGTSIGVFVSEDNGNTWHNYSIHNISNFFIDSDKLYYSTNENGIFTCNELGESLTLKNSSNSGLPSDSVTAYTLLGDYMFAGFASKGLAKSKNGISWVAVDNNLPDKHILSLASLGNTLYAGTTTGVYMSADSGQSWKLSLKVNLFNTNLRIITNGDKVFYCPSTSGQFMFSPDKGLNWKSLPVYSAYSCLMVDTTMYICGKDLMVCSDKGDNLQPIITSGLPRNIVDITYSKGVFFASTGDLLKGGVFMSIDKCNTWSLIGKDSTIFANRLIVKGDYLYASNNPKGISRINISTLRKSLQVEGSVSVCLGDTVTYKVNEAKTVYTTWEATKGQIINWSDSNVVVCWNEVGKGDLIITKFDSNGAKGYGKIYVEVNPVPDKPIISVNGNIFTSSSSQGNQWYFNNKFIPNATSSSYYANKSGYYSVKVTLNGCSSQMSDLFLGVDDNPELKLNYNLYPNPVCDILYIQGEPTTQKIKIINTLGTTLFESDFTNELYIGNLPSGYYQIKIGNFQDKFIKLY